MKTMNTSSSHRGIALVIVLGFLVILSSLAIAFFSSVTTELKASRNYSNTVTTRQLADTAVNIVEGQIREATSMTWNTSAHSWGAWASQPGMIRVFGLGANGVGSGASSAPFALYKLYSAKQMVVRADTTPATLSNFDPEALATTYGGNSGFGSSGDLAQDWDAYPAIFTDLNDPVMVQDMQTPGSTASNTVFPIIDPRAMAGGNGTAGSPSLINVASGDTFWGLAEGFSFTQTVDKAKTPTSLTDPLARLPMPARWIYVLQDGSLVVPDSDPQNLKNGAQFTGANVPTVNNPIVGRVAFWTDDDTSKININTSAGFAKYDPTTPSGFQSSGYNISSYAGSFWDTPRFYTGFDIGLVNTADGTLVANSTTGAGGLAACQPAQNEYQRYPGHPMTTSLGAVFSSLLGSEQLYYLTPRTSPTTFGPGQGGVSGIFPNTSIGGTARLQRAVAPSINPKLERLYDNVDEMLWAESNASPSRMTTDKYLASIPAQSGYPGEVPLTGPYAYGSSPSSGVVNPATLEKMKFFLTASSRAPDLNLYGTPRVCIWPVPNSKTSGQNTFDKAIAFDCTVGATTSTAKRFFFERGAGNSSSLAENKDISDGNLSYTGTGRTTNLPLLNYLHALGTLPEPGFGSATFAAKYQKNNNWDMILAEIFDYIRVANLCDTTLVTTSSFGMYPYQFASAGHVCPSRYNVFQSDFYVGGFGRTSTIPEAALVFYVSGWTCDAPGKVSVTYDYTSTPQGEISAKGVPVYRLYRGSIARQDAWQATVDEKGTPEPITAYFMKAFLLLPTVDVMQGYAPKQSPYRQAATSPTTANDTVDAPVWDVNYNVRFTLPGGGNPRLIPAEKLFIEVQGLNQFKVQGYNGNTYPLCFPTDAKSIQHYFSGSAWSGRNFGGYEGFTHTLGQHWGFPPSFVVNQSNGNVAFSQPGITSAGGSYSQNPSWYQPNFYTLQSGAGAMGCALGTANAPGAPNGLDTADTTAGWQGVLVNPSGNFTFIGNDGQYGGTSDDVVVKIFFGVPPPFNFYSTPSGGYDYTTYPSMTPPFGVSSPSMTSGAIPATNPSSFPTQLIQTINLRFPSGLFPVPQRNYRMDSGGFVSANQGTFDAAGRIESAQSLLDTYGWDNTSNNNLYQGTSATGITWSDTITASPIALQGRIGWCYDDSNNPNTNTSIHGNNRFKQIIQPGDTIRSVCYGTYAQTSTPFVYTPFSGPNLDGDLRILALHGGDPRNAVTGTGPTDATQNFGAPIPRYVFLPHPDYANTTYHWATSMRYSDGTQLGANLTNQPGAGTIPMFQADAGVGGTAGTFAESPAFMAHIKTGPNNSVPNYTKCAVLPMSQAMVTNPPQQMKGVARADSGNPPGDFDTGLGSFPDGSFANKQDEGNVIFKYWNQPTQSFIYPVAYANNYNYEPPGDIFFSPNRQMPSPGLFGSLPSHAADPFMPGGPLGANQVRQYETLAFCPNTCGPNHPGNIVLPRDHLLLDLFNMPFVDPYLISEPLSTAGRVNLNYIIAPYSHIKRSTALRAALASLRVTAVSDKLVQAANTSGQTNYKMGTNQNGWQVDSVPADNPRFMVNRDETIKAFDAYFGHYTANLGKTGGFFRSASQICERFLYPMGNSLTYQNEPSFSGTNTFDPLGTAYEPQSAANAESSVYNFWYQANGSGNGRNLTGDNCREKPYSDLYPRVTTKSNTYTVHMRVQTVRQAVAPKSDGSMPPWLEGRDQVLGEYRGSVTIERYLDPNDPVLPAHLFGGALATSAIGDSLEPYYRFRVVNTKKFAPQ